MNAQQSKNIYEYQNIVDDIIIANCDPTVRGSLLALDRACILIQFRVDTIGDTLEINGQTYDLTDHIASFSQTDTVIDTTVKTIKFEGISVECSVPTLEEERNTNNNTLAIFKKLDKQQEMVGKIFLIELTKHIKKVTFDNTDIDFSDLSTKQQIGICEMLPMTLSQKIIEYIETLRKVESKFTKITIDDKTVDIPVDSQLFNK